MTEEILTKFLNDQCSSEELKEVICWLNDNPFDIKSEIWALKDWNEFNFEGDLLQKEKLNTILNEIHNKIEITNRHLEKKSIIPSISLITKVAALLLLPVLGIFLYLLSIRSFNSDKYVNLATDTLEVVTPIGSKTVVQLSDGSEVFLNHGSKLTYPQKFNGKYREVILSGEGYFNVTHDADWPFIVSTNKIDIKAVGTSFNVMAYPNENIIETTLVEGRIIVQTNKNKEASQTLDIMAPGQHISYNLDTQKKICTKGDVDRYISWKDGKLIFRNESITNITDRLSRWYNVDFIFENEEARSFTYTATFVDETLFQILDLLKIATPITYETLPRQKMPDGTFSKQKIVIKIRDNT